MIEKTGEEKIFIGVIRKCNGIKKNVCGEFSGLGTIDRFGSLEISSEIYKSNALLLKVSDNKYVDISHFTCFEDLRKIVECVDEDEPLEGVILSDFEICQGKLFVDGDSLVSFADTLKDFVDGNERTTKDSYNKIMTKNIKKRRP